MTNRVEPYVKVNIEMRDEPTRLAVDGATNIGCVIVAPVGPRMALIQGPKEFLSTYTIDGSIPRDADITLINAYYMSFFAGLVVARSINSSATGGVAILGELYNNVVTLSTQPTYFNDGVELIKKSEFSFVPSVVVDESSAKSAEYYGFIIDGILYYSGDLKMVIADLDSQNNDDDGTFQFSSLEAVSIEQYDNDSPMAIANLVAELNREGNYVASYENSAVKLYHDEFTHPSINIATKYLATGGQEKVEIAPVNMESMSVSTTNTYDLGTKSKIATISCKDPQSAKESGNTYSFSTGASRIYKGHQVFDLTLNDGSADRTYLVSFDQDAVDSSDASCYIEILNSMEDGKFEITVMEPIEQKVSAISQVKFGKAFVDADQSKLINCLIPALYSLEDQESYNIAYLAPGGITNLQYVKALNDVGFRNRWFVPVDIPYDRINSNSIINYGVQVPDSYGLMVVGPFDKNTGLLGWMSYIAASTLYYERVFTNKASNSEFAPVFDAQTGLMAYTNPVKLIDKKQREKLLSQAQPINYVLYDEAEQSFYLNDNWNHYTLADNVMGEECATRMVFKIARDLQRLYKQFKAKHNSMATRKMVEDITSLYFKQNIMNQNFHPEEFMVICDRTNNTDDIINSRKLAVTVKVRLYKSTKYITVLEEIYSVGGASFEE